GLLCRGGPGALDGADAAVGSGASDGADAAVGSGASDGADAAVGSGASDGADAADDSGQEGVAEAVSAQLSVQGDAGGVAAPHAGQDVGGQAEGDHRAHVPGHVGDAGPVRAEDPLASQPGQVEAGVVVRQPFRRQPGQVEPDVVAG